ncbi:hypothetical protein [Oleiharenicola lentus]|uniref:hypothetical protein n=1 Tax=Oleiharenicola lentus TaxID=2508720 RepID=UPI003F674CF4
MKRFLILIGCVTVAAGLASAQTWADAIAPILYRSCVECHRPGKVAPFSLLTYQDAAKRARFIAEAAASRAMPPWLPDGLHAAFLGERKLSNEEIALLKKWSEAGAPSGDLAKAPVPPAETSEGWLLGKPDLVVRMRQPAELTASSTDSYKVFPVPYSLGALSPEVIAAAKISDSDVLAVAAVEIRAGNEKVFHHGDVWVDLTGTARQREAEEGGNGFTSFGTPGFPPAVALGGRVPGMTPRRLPPGIAATVLPASGDVVFQIHYRATGKAEIDQSEIGLHFMRQPTNRIMDSLLLRSFKLDIPAGEANFLVEDSLEVPADCIVMNVLPHMHFVAREIHAQVVFPDGTKRALIDVTRWNFKWQDRYAYREPFLLPKGSRIECRWVFDNSANNPANPFSPPRAIHFGPNATDEMCALDLGVVPMNLGDVPLFAEARENKLREKIADLTPEQRARHNWDEAFRAAATKLSP